MVLFGENLASLMQPGWEPHYIDYAALKVIVAKIKQAGKQQDDADAASALSEDFLAKATQQIVGVNTFVADQKKELASTYDKIKAAHSAAMEGAPTLTVPADGAEDGATGWTVADATSQLGTHPKLKEHVQALGELSRGLDALRRFVGTNVIAATKIVKKHDKHLAKELSKREAIAKAIKSQPFYTDAELPRLCTQVDHLRDKTLALLYTGAEENAGGGSPSASDVEDADEETSELRVLPDWLLKGAEDDVEAAVDTKSVFVHTYLFDWSFVKVVVQQDTTGEEEKWDVDFTDDTIRKWGDMNGTERVQASFSTLMKLVAVFTALYFFICSLSFLADGFRLVAGKQAGKVFAESEIFNNQVAGLMVGVLVTVLVQSSSTSTSIAITMVGAGLLTVKQAIPIIMGANIGTSVTSTIVALGQAGDRDEFRRSFAAATVHDMFNFLSVSVLLPIEIATGYLYEISTGIVESYSGLTSQEKPPDILKVVTKPFTKLVIQIDKKIINKLAAATTEEDKQKYEEMSLLKAPKTCSAVAIEASCVAADDLITADVTACSDITELGDEEACEAVGTDRCTYDEGYDPEDCSDVHYIFEGMYDSWSDTGAGILILFLALFILCLCLYLIVKLLKSLLQGRVAVWLHATVNGNVPDLRCLRADGQEGCCKEGVVIPMGWLTGYLAMAAGMGLTICVQSSSITTSALTPLVGVGVIKLERMYPTVLGANIGTTVTGLLAALAADGEKLQYTLAVAYSHLFFNISGIFLFYVIWPMRALPIAMARRLGNITANYRWFPIAYIFVMFFIVPGLFVALSIASSALTIIVAVTVVVTIIFTAVVNHYQDTKRDSLPGCLQSWDCLPLFMRSLEPYDRICCVVCNRTIAKKTAAAEAKLAEQKSGAISKDSVPAKDDLQIATQRLDLETPDEVRGP
jgi:sodium-dependent phosphate cotransporter